MHNFKELKVWKMAMELTVDIYKLTASFPMDERFGLISQLRRSAVSVSSNIAEGCGRKTDQDFSRFLGFSLGSQYEIETQLIISKELNLITNEQFEPLSASLTELQKMTYTLINKFSKET